VFEPAGATFDPPLTITLPFTGPDEEARLYWSNGFDGWNQPGNAVFDNGIATLQVSHFSSGFIALNGPVEDVDIVVQPAKVDVLFVIDDSCSMSEEQAQVAVNFPAFMDFFLGSGIDYHLGVTTTDVDSTNPNAGRLRRVMNDGATHRFIDTTTANPTAVFSAMANAGTNGSPSEAGREAAYQLLETGRDLPRNQDFYRDDSILHMVFVSDEQDQSIEPSIADFRSWRENLKARPEDVVSHAITGIPGQLCTAVFDAGTLYITYADQSGGAVQDLCEPDWAPLMEELGLITSGLRREFFLLNPAAGDVVEVSVFVPGPDVTQTFTADEFTYDAAGPSITFDTFVPEPGSVVRLSYTPE
jgi:hypothetical protein